jgi:hypothetical protein
VSTTRKHLTAKPCNREQRVFGSNPPLTLFYALELIPSYRYLYALDRCNNSSRTYEADCRLTIHPCTPAFVQCGLEPPLLYPLYLWFLARVVKGANKRTAVLTCLTTWGWYDKALVVSNYVSKYPLKEGRQPATVRFSVQCSANRFSRIWSRGAAYMIKHEGEFSISYWLVRIDCRSLSRPKLLSCMSWQHFHLPREADRNMFHARVSRHAL